MYRHIILLFSLAALSIASPITSVLKKNNTFPYQFLKRSCINPSCSATRITHHGPNPPVNIWTADLIQEFNAYLLSLQNTASTTPKIVVVSSDVPDFFIAGIDVHLLSVSNPVPPSVDAADALNKYYENLNLLLTLPVIFVAEINGRTWGAGDEHAIHMDMRFAGPEAIISAPEASSGIIHVGAVQWLVQSVGPGRTMEKLLSSAQFDGEEAARIGWVNSAFTTASALREHIDTLVTRIAKFDVEALAATKQSVAQQAPTQEMLAKDQAAFVALASRPEVQARMDKFLELSNDQGKEWELNISDNFVNFVI